MLFTKEFYDVIKDFETYAGKYLMTGSMGLEKESKELWKKGIYYCDGKVNQNFKLYLAGYSLGKIA